MSTMATEGNQQQPEEPPNKIARIDECRENANPNEANVLATGNEAIESSSDLPNGRRPLPLELNCEIFKCLKILIQRKFICGLGRDIYGIFRYKLLVKKLGKLTDQKTSKSSAQSVDPNENYAQHLSGRIDNQRWMEIFFARLAFSISGNCRKKDDYPGTIMYYFEVARMSLALSNWVFYIGLTNNENAIYPDSYAFSMAFVDYCYIAGKKHAFEWPDGAIKPTANKRDDVAGCGLLLSPSNELSIFFTGNGILMGKQIQINLSADCVYPVVSMADHADMPLSTNFDDDSAKPFKYDIEKCPGLVGLIGN